MQRIPNTQRRGCHLPTGAQRVPLPRATPQPATQDVVGDIYKALRAAAQAGDLDTLCLLPVKQSVTLRGISTAELREAVICTLHSALLASTRWHWWAPGSQLVSAAILHEQPSVVEAHTVTLDVQLQGDHLQLLCTIGTLLS